MFTQNIIFKCTEDKNSWFGILFFSNCLSSKCQCKKLEKIIIKHIFTLSSDVILTIRWGMSFWLDSWKSMMSSKNVTSVPNFSKYIQANLKFPSRFSFVKISKSNQFLYESIEHNSFKSSLRFPKFYLAKTCSCRE